MKLKIIKDILNIIKVLISFGIFICPLWLHQNWMWWISWFLATTALDKLFDIDFEY